MKRLILLACTLLLVQVGLARQTGLISGRVVASDNTPQSDVPIIGGGDQIGMTDDAGGFEIDGDQFEEGERITVTVLLGDDPKVYFDEEGENSCEEEQEDDDLCVGAGWFNWTSGNYLVTLGEDPGFGPDNGGGLTDMNGMGDDGMGDGGGDDDGMFGGEIAIGYSLEFERITFTIRGHVDLPVDAAPLSICVGFDYLPEENFVSILAPMVDLTYTHSLTPEASAYVGAGYRGYRQKFSAEGFSSTSTESGVGLRGGGLYDVGPVDAFAELDLAFAYSTTLPTVRVGARMKF